MVLRQRDRRIDTPAAGPAPSCRLHVVRAEGCRRAVIFRRGPTRSTRLIAWDMASDTFEPGQWMRRASVYPERASLSPDGEYLLSFIGTFRGPFQTYSVLSRPPFFTALALWPKGDTWGGGGTFVGPRELVLEGHDDIEPLLAPGFRWPGGFLVHPGDPAGRARLERWRKDHDHWRPREQERDRRSFARQGEAGVTLLATWQATPRFPTTWAYALKARARTLPLPGAQWADFDANGDLVFSTGGALDRLPCAALTEAVVRQATTPFVRRLADFTGMRFEEVAAPYATGPVSEPGADDPMSDDDGAFAPRLDRVSKEDRRRRRAARKALAARGGD